MRNLTAILGLAILALVFGGAESCAASSEGEVVTPTPAAAAVIAPDQPGLYAVGVQRMTFTRPSNEDGSPRTLSSWIWYPAKGVSPSGEAPGLAPVEDAGMFPIVVYSHGSGGKPEYQRFLTQHLASRGFVVVAPPHPGNVAGDCYPCGPDSIIPSAIERPDDVTFVLDEMIALKNDPTNAIGRIINPELTAIMGHSFGGWTALYVAPEGRFDVVVSHAPGLPIVLLSSAPRVTAPTLIIASEGDAIVPIEQVDLYWDALPAATRKAYVQLPRGNHLNYIDNCFSCGDGVLSEERGHELIQRYTTAWLYVHLLGDARYEQFLAADPPEAVVVP